MTKTHTHAHTHTHKHTNTPQFATSLKCQMNIYTFYLLASRLKNLHLYTAFKQSLTCNEGKALKTISYFGRYT